MTKWRIVQMLEAIKTAFIGVWIIFLIGLILFSPTIEPPLSGLLIVCSVCGIPVISINVLIEKLIKA